MNADFASGSGPAVLAYDASAETGDAASRDVFDQLDAVETALRGAGMDTVRVPVSLDLGRFKSLLQQRRPRIVVNLVESLDGSDRLQTIIPLVLEDWGVPFTGTGSAAMLLANDKIGGKTRLAESGLPVPECVWDAPEGGLRRAPPAPDGADIQPGTWIVKTRESHASLFLDDDSVVDAADFRELETLLREKRQKHGMPFFAEQFIDGREFNLTVLENGRGRPVVMPAAEIRFDALPKGKPRIVGYAAKWEEESPEYTATPRSFEFTGADAPLIAEISALALKTWDVLGLSGYARVDFRADSSGRPYILEANANPCLAPDAGLTAAAGRGGIGYAALIAMIIESGLRRG